MFLSRATHQDQLFPCFKSSVQVSVSSHLSYLWLSHSCSPLLWDCFLSPQSHLGVCAPREWRWAYGRGVRTVVLMVLWLPPLRYRVSLSGHWWITETGGYTNGTALGHKMNDIFSLPELLELENAAKLNRSDAERLIPIVLCSMWGPRKNMWDNSIQITTPQCTQG